MYSLQNTHKNCCKDIVFILCSDRTKSITMEMGEYQFCDSLNPNTDGFKKLFESPWFSSSVQTAQSKLTKFTQNMIVV